MTEPKTFTGILEAVIPAKTGAGKPYLKIMAIPEGEEKSRTYNYHAPWEFKHASEDEIAEHIKKTLIGLVALTGMDISFDYKENPNQDPQKKPFKNVIGLSAEFKAPGEKKEEKVKEHMHKDLEEKTTDPEKEKKIAEAYKLREREVLVIDMAYYLSVAKDAWMDAIHPFDGTTTSALDATDKEAIEKIAVHLRMNKRGR